MENLLMMLIGLGLYPTLMANVVRRLSRILLMILRMLCFFINGIPVSLMSILSRKQNVPAEKVVLRDRWMLDEAAMRATKTKVEKALVFLHRKVKKWPGQCTLIWRK